MNARIVPTELEEVKLIVTPRHRDDRGWLTESWRADVFAEAGIDDVFVQENHSYSRHAGTVRGLHLQVEPNAQAKLVRVVRGAILDVAVDVRPGSPSFGRHVAVELTAGGGEQLYVPVGFAHGFCTLEPETEVVYRMSALYAPESERGLLWNDPALGIEWPVSPERATLSPRDRTHPTLAELAAEARP